MFVETAELVRNASKPFVLNAEPGDEVVIVTDSEIEESMWATLYGAANERGWTRRCVSSRCGRYTGTTRRPPRPRRCSTRTGRTGGKLYIGRHALC